MSPRHTGGGPNSITRGFLLVLLFSLVSNISPVGPLLIGSHLPPMLRGLEQLNGHHTHRIRKNSNNNDFIPLYFKYLCFKDCIIMRFQRP